MPHATRLMGLAACALLSPLAHASLPPGISGAWYNPAQSGHGLSIEIIAPDRALAFWYTYDAAGNPVTLYIDGPIIGRSIEATAFAPRGMRFGEFNSADLQMPEWGEVSIAFDSCNNGTLNWTTNSAEFGSGSTPLKRLTAIDGLACELDATAAGPQGIRSLAIETRRSGFVIPRTGYAAIDPEGVLWALEPVNTRADAVPGRTYVGEASRLLRAQLRAEGESTVSRFLTTWHFAQPNAEPALSAAWTANGAGGVLRMSVPPATEEHWSLSASSATHVMPLSAATLARRYTVPTQGQFVGFDLRLDITADGDLCLLDSAPAETCRISGRVWVSDSANGFVDFELGDRLTPASPPFRGRGWLQREAGVERLVLVGDNGSTGFGLIGR